MAHYDLHKPDDERDEDNREYDDWYRLIGPDPSPEDTPQAERQDDAASANVQPAEEDEERDPMPFGEEGAAFLRNVLQHGVFLGLGALILMILQYARQR